MYRHSITRAALTRAVKTRNRAKVEAACRAAVALWNAPGNYWPDDWHRWQNALDDVYAWPNVAPRIDDWRF